MAPPAPVDPYRVLFPAGLLLSLAGTGLWIAFFFGLTSYPGQLHADLMIGGFLLPFAAGFLMTMVPRFSRTPWASSLELGIAAGTAALLGCAALAPERHRALLSHLAIVAELVALLTFAGRRLVKARVRPVFLAPVAAGLLGGLAGAVLLAAGDLELAGPVAAGTGRALLSQGMMPLLLLGVGSRMIPRLLHGGEPPAPGLGASVVIGALFLGSFAVDAAGLPVAGRAVRAAVVTITGLAWFALHRNPARGGVLPWALRAAASCFVLGHLVTAALPAQAIHLSHVTFVGGLALATLLVATRVVLAHGGAGVEAEASSKALLAAAILVGLAAAVRASAGLTGTTYGLHLAMASALFCLGIGCWLLRFGPGLVRGPPPPPSYAAPGPAPAAGHRLGIAGPPSAGPKEP